MGVVLEDFSFDFHRAKVTLQHSYMLVTVVKSVLSPVFFLYLHLLKITLALMSFTTHIKVFCLHINIDNILCLSLVALTLALCKMCFLHSLKY